MILDCLDLRNMRLPKEFEYDERQKFDWYCRMVPCSRNCSARSAYDHILWLERELKRYKLKVLVLEREIKNGNNS